jgi:hypothetical protein
LRSRKAVAFAKTLGTTVEAGDPRAIHRRPKQPYKTRVRLPSKLDAHVVAIEYWLAAEPQLTALAIVGRLNDKHPEQFGMRQHSIVQRLLKALRKKAAAKFFAQKPPCAAAGQICKPIDTDCVTHVPGMNCHPSLRKGIHEPFVFRRLAPVCGRGALASQLRHSRVGKLFTVRVLGTALDLAQGLVTGDSNGGYIRAMSIVLRITGSTIWAVIDDPVRSREMRQPKVTH